MTDENVQPLTMQRIMLGISQSIPRSVVRLDTQGVVPHTMAAIRTLATNAMEQELRNAGYAETARPHIPANLFQPHQRQDDPNFTRLLRAIETAGERLRFR